jgi:hypothetical protein
MTASTAAAQAVMPQGTWHLAVHEDTGSRCVTAMAASVTMSVRGCVRGSVTVVRIWGDSRS